MNFKNILILLFTIGSYSLFSQSNMHDMLHSHLMDQNNVPLAGVWVSVNDKLRYQSDVDGMLMWESDKWPANLTLFLDNGEEIKVQVADEAHAAHISIDRVHKLDEVTIVDKSSREVSTLQTRNVESITSKEFEKAACCRLSESFENSGSVNVSETDAVTGAKEMEILGLRGKYSLLTLNNIPDFIGINYPFSLDMIPGTWLDNVAISKGISNSINGSNAFAGQVNIGTKDPTKDERLFVNLYTSSTSRTEGNLHFNQQLGNSSTGVGVYLHASKNFTEIDNNKDGFLDMPLSEQLNGMVRLVMHNQKNLEGGLTVQMVKDTRNGGQPGNSVNLFKTYTDARRLAVNGNLGYLGFKKEGRSVGLKYQFTSNGLAAQFGQLDYTGDQIRGYLQAVYGDQIVNEEHKILMGASYLLEDLNEHLDDRNLARQERVPGVFLEYAFSPTYTHDDIHFIDRFGLVAAIRADFHNLYGTQISPALSMKFNFDESNIIRANIGKGYRTPYFFGDNLSSFANGRRVKILGNLDDEEAINYGVSYTGKTRLFSQDLSINLDFYRTDFRNMIIADMDGGKDAVQVYNQPGKAYVNSFLASVNYNLFEGFTTKLAYKWNSNVTDELSHRVENVLMPRHRGLLSLHYTTPDKGWEFSSINTLVGTQNYMLRPNGLDRTHVTYRESKPYFTSNLQITKKWHAIDLYGGVENLTNYTQDLPVQGYSDPNSTEFDVTQVYAPILGIRGYIGVRWSPFRK